MPIQQLYLIGGAPLTGKSTLAARIAASKKNAVVLSTDNIREWMQRTCNRSDYPHLFSSYGLTAEQYYQKFPTAKAALEEEIIQGKDVETGVISLLAIQKLAWEIAVIEGIAVTPNLTRKLKELYAGVTQTTTFLYDDDLDRIKRRVFDRGLWGPSGTYPESIKPIQVEWTILYNGWYRDEAQKYGYDVTLVQENQP